MQKQLLKQYALCSLIVILGIIIKCTTSATFQTILLQIKCNNLLNN